MKKEISEKVKVSEENKKQEINATNAEIPKETKTLAKEKVNEELVSKENELKESNKVNENNQELPAIQAEKVLKSQSLLAASPVTSILKYPNVKVINNRTGEGPSISGKYAFRFVWSPQVTYEVKGSSDDRTGQSQYTFRNSNREQYVLVKKLVNIKGNGLMSVLIFTL